jgi:antirestriction protein ArdC
VGSAVGDGVSESVAHPAEERGDPTPLLGDHVLILWGAVIEHGFSTQNWLTFRRALSLGGNVRKGEHGTTVIYADRFAPDEERRRAERDGDNYVRSWLALCAALHNVINREVWIM